MLENHFISEDNEMSISKTNPAEEIDPVRYRCLDASLQPAPPDKKQNQNSNSV